MNLDDLTEIKNVYVILDTHTGELWDNGRTYNGTGEAKRSYAQRVWRRYRELPERFDDQDRFKLVKLEYKLLKVEVL